MNDVQMMIRCDYCLNAWDIDHDPDSCTCNSDINWQLMVIEQDDE